jgi:hypothetical protein
MPGARTFPAACRGEASIYSFNHMVSTKRLIVIAGPPCAGKTTLVSRVREGEYPSLCQQLRVDDPLLWTHVNAVQLPEISQSTIEQMVLHWDICTQRSPKGYDCLSELMSKSDDIVLLTLWTSPEILRRRNRSRLIRAFGSLVFRPKEYRSDPCRLRGHWQLQLVYRDSLRVCRLYHEWFEFCCVCCLPTHWILDCTATNMTMAQTFEEAKVRMLAPIKDVM